MQQKLQFDNWPQFLQFLQIERKYRGKGPAIMADKSRYKTICAYFKGKDFNRENFRALLQDMRARGLKNSTLNKMVTMAKNVDRYLNTNQLQDFTYFNEERRPDIELLTPQDVAQLAEVRMYNGKSERFLYWRNKALILLLGTTGCRISEALSLTVGDMVVSQKSVIFQKTKNYDTRTVPVREDIFDMMLKLPRKTNLVFESTRGNQLYSSDIRQELKKRAKKLGIKKPVYNHLFRHSYITTMKENGVDSIEICKIVGHRDPRTLLRYYHPDLQQKRQITQMHPLLKGRKTIAEIEKETRDFLEKIVDKDKFQLTIQSSKQNIKLNIKQIQE